MVDMSEQDFEKTIEEHLLASKFRKRLDGDYDRSLCLDTEVLFDFIRSSQVKMWQKLTEQHGDQTKTSFLKRLTKEIAERGTLYVLRKGIDGWGCHFDLAYFKPETKLNEEHRRLYNANIFSVIRQLHYSEKNENSIDMVLFLNGLPIFSAELKNPAKGQTVESAITQYRKDRDPKEPLLKFGRCLAHFSVDTDLVFMTTRLLSGATRFLPFNLGHENGAGNEPNPKGFMTFYLWEEVWQKDSLLELINRFLQMVDILDEDGKPTGEKALIFPRYHQLDVVRRLVADARSKGTGQNYLIEHSAGSGKSNTIAWLAHQLAGLHDKDDKRVFDSVIIITDRRVLDIQLRQTVESFEQTKGLVFAVDKNKSTQLAEAFAEGKDIIVTTIQTFPFVQKKLTEIQGKRFAVLIDEAHSSQTGETAREMKKTLVTGSLEEAAQKEQEGEKTDEDLINDRIEESMKEGGRLANVSFFAFTATPKNKTLELFGTPQDDGSFRPFSLYAMRQAIEEEFILDVLKNYTTFKVYFELNKKVEDDPKYSKKKGIALLKSYVDLHEHNLRAKAEIILDHFVSQVKDRIRGQAKAMVVTKSRLHAVKYKQMFDKVLKEQKLPFKALVAFSGTVKDKQNGEEFTESGMNGFPESQTAKTFRKGQYRFLIVAEKFQTGFDQPLLHTMYVDKKLSDVNAVQTLSRLNRIHPNKPDTMVLDFVNEAEHIQQSFQPYYETTVLAEATDPNKLYDLRRMVEDYLIFRKQDVEGFAKVYFSEKASQQKLRAMLDPIVLAFKGRKREEQEEFRKAVTNYVRLYAFLSHILRFQDAELEKLYQFLRILRPLLRLDYERLPVEVTEKVNMDSYRIQETSTGDIVLLSEEGELTPASDIGTGKSGAEDHVPLSEIVEYVNEHYGTDFTDSDKVRYFAQDMQRRLADREGLKQALDPAINPAEETRRLAFSDFFNEVLEDMIDANTDIYKKIVEDERFGDIFKLVMFRRIVDELRKESA